MKPGAAHGGRVLYMLRYYPTLTETFVYGEILSLLEQGWQVEVAALAPRGDGERFGAPLPVTVHYPRRWPAYLPMVVELLRACTRPAGRRAWRWLRQRFSVKDALKALYLSARARGADRVHVHFAGEAAEWAWVAWRRFGVPYTVTVHAVDLFRPRASLPQVLAAAQGVITISAFNQDLLQRAYGVAAHLVRCGVSLSGRPQAEPARRPPVVISIGRWVEKKGFDLLIQAVESMDEPVQLWLISDAPPQVASERVHVLGLRPAREIPALLAQATASPGLVSASPE